MVAYLYYFYLWTIFLVQVSGFSLVLLVLLVLFFVLAGMEQRRVEDEIQPKNGHTIEKISKRKRICPSSSSLRLMYLDLCKFVQKENDEAEYMRMGMGMLRQLFSLRGFPFQKRFSTMIQAGQLPHPLPPEPDVLWFDVVSDDVACQIFRSANLVVDFLEKHDSFLKKLSYCFDENDIIASIQRFWSAMNHREISYKIGGSLRHCLRSLRETIIEAEMRERGGGEGGEEARGRGGGFFDFSRRNEGRPKERERGRTRGVTEAVGNRPDRENSLLPFPLFGKRRKEGDGGEENEGRDRYKRKVGQKGKDRGGGEGAGGSTPSVWTGIYHETEEHTPPLFNQIKVLKCILRTLINPYLRAEEHLAILGCLSARYPPDIQTNFPLQGGWGLDVKSDHSLGEVGGGRGMRGMRKVYADFSRELNDISMEAVENPNSDTTPYLYQGVLLSLLIISPTGAPTHYPSSPPLFHYLLTLTSRDLKIRERSTHQPSSSPFSFSSSSPSPRPSSPSSSPSSPPSPTRPSSPSLSPVPDLSDMDSTLLCHLLCFDCTFSIYENFLSIEWRGNYLVMRLLEGEGEGKGEEGEGGGWGEALEKCMKRGNFPFLEQLEKLEDIFGGRKQKEAKKEGEGEEEGRNNSERLIKGVKEGEGEGEGEGKKRGGKEVGNLSPFLPPTPPIAPPLSRWGGKKVSPRLSCPPSLSLSPLRPLPGEGTVVLIEVFVFVRPSCPSSVVVCDESRSMEDVFVLLPLSPTSSPPSGVDLFEPPPPSSPLSHSPSPPSPFGLGSFRSVTEIPSHAPAQSSPPSSPASSPPSPNSYLSSFPNSFHFPSLPSFSSHTPNSPPPSSPPNPSPRLPSPPKSLPPTCLPAPPKSRAPSRPPSPGSCPSPSSHRTPPLPLDTPPLHTPNSPPPPSPILPTPPLRTPPPVGTLPPFPSTPSPLASPPSPTLVSPSPQNSPSPTPPSSPLSLPSSSPPSSPSSNPPFNPFMGYVGIEEKGGTGGKGGGKEGGRLVLKSEPDESCLFTLFHVEVEEEGTEAEYSFASSSSPPSSPPIKKKTFIRLLNTSTSQFLSRPPAPDLPLPSTLPLPPSSSPSLSSSFTPPLSPSLSPPLSPLNSPLRSPPNSPRTPLSPLSTPSPPCSPLHENDGELSMNDTCICISDTPWSIGITGGRGKEERGAGGGGGELPLYFRPVSGVLCGGWVVPEVVRMGLVEAEKVPGVGGEGGLLEKRVERVLENGEKERERARENGGGRVGGRGLKVGGDGPGLRDSAGDFKSKLSRMMVSMKSVRGETEERGPKRETKEQSIEKKREMFGQLSLGEQLMGMMEDERGMELFTTHLKKELSIENALFWKDVQELEGLGNEEKEKRMELFNEIYAKYIAEMAPYQVNFSYEVLHRVREAKVNGHEDIDPRIFEGPKRELIDLLKMDSLTRFKASPLFEEYLEGLDVEDLLKKYENGPHPQLTQPTTPVFFAN